MRACERLRAGLAGGLRVATARAAAPEAVAALIGDVNFFRNKARHIVACADALASRHGGRVPSAFAALTALPGVGPKIANLVLSVPSPAAGRSPSRHQSARSEIPAVQYTRRRKRRRGERGSPRTA